MIAQNVVDPLGILALEGREHIQKLMRTISLVVRIHKRPVDQLLQYQVPAGMAIEGRERQDLLERRDIAVQVAHDHHLGGVFERDDSARIDPACHGRAQSRGGWWSRLSRVGHEGDFRSDVRSGLPVCFQRGLPVFVQGFQTGLELDVAILVSDGLDGIAPGGGLTEKVFEFVRLLFKLADFAFDVDGLAVRKLSLGLGGSRGAGAAAVPGARPRAGRGRRRRASWPVPCPPALFP